PPALQTLTGRTYSTTANFELPSAEQGARIALGDLDGRFAQALDTRSSATSSDAFFADTTVEEKVIDLPAVVDELHRLPDSESVRRSEEYERVVENPFKSVRFEPLATVSVDVDTASYSNIRRMLTNGNQPPPGAVRIEEMINYFPYSDVAPAGDDPLAVRLEVASCPWKLEHRLLRVSLAAQRIERDESRPANLVFLIDVSGSMNDTDKLPLLVESLELLVDELK
ncbi:MAG: von Willebrand factor type A domain-containing protein, partial [Candidatus Eremiobacteraeota bacterium]|nr:von Willebrand factor type A domain-containing protein [Candidatus Eremiobacteraeota bacterium]